MKKLKLLLGIDNDIFTPQDIPAFSAAAAEEGRPRYGMPETMEDKLRNAVGKYVLLTRENTSLDARYKGRIDACPVPGKYGLPSVKGHFIGAGCRSFLIHEVKDVVPLSGMEAEVLRGKITGKTIQEYILPLTDTQLSFLAEELEIDPEDLPFLPEDRIDDIAVEITGLEAEESAAAERGGREISERGRTAAEIAAVIAEKLGKHREAVGKEVRHEA